ncbi:YbaY family lipoprotein [Aliivibrio sp. S4TY2]|uniref:YbaY family lipoprotein n=1 Tax=unclassified Aliivibrio TaxID=2645654 RepID=UPI0023799182|nr:MULTISPECIES: YbaY family lipoprotein [unclassified Aliivibrio]MDD9155478.1 YbaY family lipoprotein [Aliivibrio sp. S4TY2]MDD9160345.1 YbaY family lipoprotein [Aliivibrio sp. S4TY1]MDD9164757.1 YbaY family lipoprotein [Aliivibrio sp. S4MY2]MDD9168563.1 YbaY family lipoprotein [Aliivibrio sp. S4MY4]MDD9185091.1 YbaY family lipoprotein [Aliivibrio sp. S4MY3]
MKKSLLVALSVATGITMVGCNSTDKSEKETVKQEVVVQEEVTQIDAANTDVIEMAETQVVTGSVGYRERIALPTNAVITVTLEDISLADAPSKTITEQTFEAADKSSPFDYSLEFDTADIQANHRYSVRATIKVDGKLRFTTDTNYAVITDEAKTMQQDLMLKGVRQ